MLPAQENEEELRRVFAPGTTFVFTDGMEYVSQVCEKPRPQRPGGEPKTDVYLHAVPTTDDASDLILKFQLKKTTWEFIVNHMQTSEARDIFDADFEEMIQHYLQRSEELLVGQPVIDVGIIGRKIIRKMGAGAFTLGWEMMITKKNRGLSLGILPRQYVREAVLGERLEERRRHALVGDDVIPDSGIPTHVVELNLDGNTMPLDVFENMISAEEFITNYQDRCRVILKANNYRSLSNKTSSGRMDNKRYLFVQNMWSVSEDGCLTRGLNFNEPFEPNIQPMQLLEGSLTQLGIDIRNVVLNDITFCNDVPENHQD